MARRLSAEQIVTKLRQIEVLQAQGKTAAAACKEAGTTEQSCPAWIKSISGPHRSVKTCSDRATYEPVSRH